PNAELYRAVDDGFSAIELRDDGLILSRSLAGLLHLSPGDTLSVSLREGRRPTLELPVAGLADTLLGSPAYFTLEALGRALKEPGRASGAYLRIDSAHSDRLYRKLRDMPAVAGVSLRSESRAAFEQMMDTGAGAMRYIMAAIAAIITFGIVY